MIILRHYDQKISLDAGSIPVPASLPKVDTAFHSLDGVGKISKRADEALHGCYYIIVKFDSCNN